MPFMVCVAIVRKGMPVYRTQLTTEGWPGQPFVIVAVRITVAPLTNIVRVAALPFVLMLTIFAGDTDQVTVAAVGILITLYVEVEVEFVHTPERPDIVGPLHMSPH